MNREKLLAKLNEIESDMTHLSNYCKAWETEYEIITDQYMNGDIRYPIGKEQRAITKKIEKAQRRYCKLQQQAYKIREKLSLQF